MSASAQTKNSKVNIFYRLAGEPSQTSIRNIAVKKYLYAPLADTGRDRDFRREIDLAELDGLLSCIWPKLACGFVDLSYQPLRKSISLYLATQFLRHPYTFVRQRESRRELIRFIESAPRDQDGLPDIRWIEIGSTMRRVLCFDDLNEPRSQYYKVAADQAGLYNFMTWVNTDEPCFQRGKRKSACSRRKVRQHAH